MRSKLLLSTAVLLAGIGLASAQNTPSGGGAKESGAAPAQEHQSAPKQGQAQQKEPMQRGQKNQTTGQAPQKDQGAQSIDDQRDKAQPQRSQRNRDQTTGQGQRDQSQSPSRTQREQSPTQAQPPQREQGQQGQSGQSQPGQAQQGQAQQGQAQQGKAAGSTTLTTEQRTKIRQTVLAGGNVPRATNVNFSINVGTVVPTSVRVVAVPAVIVEIHPEWRGYMYFVVGDEIIIVDRSHRIVAVLAV